MSSAHPSGKPNSRHTTRHPRRRSLDRRRHPPNCSTSRGNSRRHRSAPVPRGVDSARIQKIRVHRARDRRGRGANAPSRPTARSIGRSPPLVGSISFPASPLGLRGSQTVVRWLHDLPCPRSTGGLAAPASANASRRRRHPEKGSRPPEHAPPPTMADQPDASRTTWLPWRATRTDWFTLADPDRKRSGFRTTERRGSRNEPGRTHEKPLDRVPCHEGPEGNDLLWNPCRSFRTMPSRGLRTAAWDRSPGTLSWRADWRR